MLELKRGMIDMVFFQPFSDLPFHVIDSCNILFMGVHMGIKDVEIRAQAPDMDMVYSGHSADRGHVCNDRIEVHGWRGELEEDPECFPEDPGSGGNDENGNET